jgi:NADPH:quinone reductase-like Zn-dependent oxidoreductase
MRAAAVDRFGGPKVLKPHTVPVPDVGPTDVLVALDSAAVASWDKDMREGWFPGKRPPFPIVLGTEGAGTVEAVGSRVKRLHVGDRVYAYGFGNAKGGLYAEHAVIDANWVAPVPRGLSLQQAAAIPITGLTALQGVDDALHVRKGETVIVHGATGGVGTLAVQFAKLRGARVIASASGADGVRLARRLGADIALDGRRKDLADAVLAAVPEGVDAILAFAGGPALTRCLDALKPRGRVAHPNGVEPRPRKRRGVKLITYDGNPGVREMQRLTRAVEALDLQVPIAATYPLSKAADAHARLDAGHVLGKILLRIH